MAADRISDVVSSPGFEGFEKRLEIEFLPRATTDVVVVPVGKSFLRSLPLSALEEILTAAQCSIVSGLSNRALDSYVLSESSLFVYPLKIIIKTCGTTQLLNAIPALLTHADSLSLTVHRCRYSRGAFLFPAAQSYPHRNFSEEVQFLDKHFGSLGSGSKASVINGQWHVYSAVAGEEGDSRAPYYSSVLEVCMTELDRAVASKFFKQAGYDSARDMTVSSGIDNILPDFEICDFAFDPCGYSMNAIEGGAYSTIHISPEENCSYASFEIMDSRTLDLEALMYKIICTFRPAMLSFSLYRTGEKEEQGGVSWSVIVDSLGVHGYEGRKPVRQKLPGGGALDFFSFKR